MATETASVRYMIDDVPAAIAFYTEHLGFTLETDASPAFASVVRGPLRLLLSGPRSSGARPMRDGSTPVPGGWTRIQVLVDDLEHGLAVVDAYGAEHLEIQARNAAGIAQRVQSAGAIFVGPWSPVSLGDYMAGSNHVLPTGRRARFSSGLSVPDFMKRTSFIALDEAALKAIGPAAIELADAEGLTAHARSVEVRLGI